MSAQVDYETLGSPVDKTAYRVTQQGINFNCRKQNGQMPEWEAPPKTAPILPNIPDVRGLKFGKMTVIGLMPKDKQLAKKAPAKWLVRCDCGVYSVRKKRAIENPKNDNDACEKCKYLESLKKHEKKRRTGFYDDERVKL